MRLLKLPAAVLVLALFAAAPALATTYRHMTLDELVEAAELAFHGVVEDTRVTVEDGDPWTHVTFRLEELLLEPDGDEEDGTVPADGTVTLAFLGGESGGARLSVALMPEFAEGDEVLVLAYAGRYYSPVTGFRQGLWRLDDTGRWLSETGSEFPLADGEADGAGPEEAVAELRRRLEAR